MSSANRTMFGEQNPDVHYCSLSFTIDFPYRNWVSRTGSTRLPNLYASSYKQVGRVFQEDRFLSASFGVDLTG